MSPKNFGLEIKEVGPLDIPIPVPGGNSPLNKDKVVRYDGSKIQLPDNIQRIKYARTDADEDTKIEIIAETEWAQNLAKSMCGPDQIGCVQKISRNLAKKIMD